jgi:hypothetical protein
MVRHVFEIFSSGFASWNTGSKEDWIERNPFGFPLCFRGRFHQKRKWLNNPEHAICPRCQPPFHPALTIYTSRLTQPPLQRHVLSGPGSPIPLQLSRDDRDHRFRLQLVSPDDFHVVLFESRIGGEN